MINRPTRESRAFAFGRERKTLNQFHPVEALKSSLPHTQLRLPSPHSFRTINFPFFPPVRLTHNDNLVPSSHIYLCWRYRIQIRHQNRFIAKRRSIIITEWAINSYETLHHRRKNAKREELCCLDMRKVYPSPPSRQASFVCRALSPRFVFRVKRKQCTKHSRMGTFAPKETHKIRRRRRTSSSFMSWLASRACRYVRLLIFDERSEDEARP